MRKQSYLRRLRKSLTGVPAREKENLIEYYSELIDDAYERGKTTREIFRELEPPQVVAENYKRENAVKSDRFSERDDLDERLERLERLEREERIARLERLERERNGNKAAFPEYGAEPASRSRKEKRSHGALYWLIVAPIRLILAIIGIVLGFSVLIAGFAVVIAVIAVNIALFFGGIYAIVMSFHMFTVNASIAMAQVGAGLALIGLSVAFGFLTPLVCRGYGALVGWLFRGFRRSGKERPYRRRSVAGKFATAACGLALIVGGGVLGTIGFGRLGYDYRKLAVYDDYTETVAEYDLANEAAIRVDCSNLNLTVKPAQTEKIKITYFTAETDPKTVTEENGSIVFAGADCSGKEGVKKYLQDAWNRGIAFSSLSHLYNTATIEVPQSFGGVLDVTVDNGPVVLAGLTLEEAKINTQNSVIHIEECTFGTLTAETSNGMVTVKKLNASQVNLKASNGYIVFEDSACATLTAATSNGAIEAEQSKAESAELSTQNGAISLEKFEAVNVNLKTQNGVIAGSIKGKLEDYRIQASTNNGSCNLVNKDTGTYLLSAHSTNGKIDIGFIE